MIKHGEITSLINHIDSLERQQSLSNVDLFVHG